MTVSLTPEDNHSNAPVVPVDLWVELERLGRDDRDLLAARWDDVRRSRRARHDRTARPAPAATSESVA